MIGNLKIDLVELVWIFCKKFQLDRTLLDILNLNFNAMLAIDKDYSWKIFHGKYFPSYAET